MTEFDNKNITLIIGNGFDISLGLNTRYSDFIEYINPQHFLDNKITAEYIALNDEANPETKEQAKAHVALRNNELFKDLCSKKHEKWIDIEYELENNAIKHIEEHNKVNEYYLFPTYKTILNYPIVDKQNYNQIKYKLKKYLKHIDANFQLKRIDKPASNLVYSIFDKRRRKERNSSTYFDLTTNDLKDGVINILNFNYTNTFNKIVRHMQESHILFEHEFPHYKHIHVHGSVDKEIVFGIDDKVHVNEDYVYLLKSCDKSTQNLNFNNILNHSKIIIFFGYSLGVSDASYFEDFFNSLCEHNDIDEKSKRKIVFYYKGEENYLKLFFRLKELTSHNTAKLLRYNRILFIDVDHYESCFEPND